MNALITVEQRHPLKCVHCIDLDEYATHINKLYRVYYSGHTNRFTPQNIAHFGERRWMEDQPFIFEISVN